MRAIKVSNVVLLAVVAALLFIPFLGRVHLFDWDEINFAECAREMIKLDDYSRIYVNFKPFWEKPPMFFWMQSTAMKLFGINEFASRLPNAICGIVTLVTLFLIGSRLYDRKFGILWVLAYGGSLFPNMYFKSGIIDPWFNLFTFISLYYFILYHWKRNDYDKPGLNRTPLFYAVWSGLFMGLAILTKGQVALMVFLLVLGVYFIWNRFRFFFGWGHALLFLVVATAVSCTWYGWETWKNGPWFITEFLKYQYRLFTTHDAGQAGFFGYHYVVILIGCFPSSIFAIPSFFKTTASSRSDKDFKRWMVILFWVVTLLFSIVQSRIIHYSSLAWFPVTFLAAYTFYKWDLKEMPYKKYIGVLVTILGVLVAVALLGVTLVALNLKKLIPYVKDPFAQANMAADVHWSGWEGAVGTLMVITLIVGVVMLRKQRFTQAAWTYFGGTALVIFLAAAIIVPKVERYSQGAAIDFFEARQGEDCYVTVLGYWSYAPFFYTHKEKPANENAYSEEWLLKGDIDKPAYFVTKIDRVEGYLQHTGILELYRKNGFVFLKREKVTK
ncbi:ArnT family glycosyltransferase [Chitinophaga flava]|uniref:Glycosyl transferase n=1 Tax=Chitinophaga flava TaxID=2259036 RepID=A0A365XT49_9BACT|nr:glycosyltransferase family 39 protein [Chitinophaga flava]RBL89532.1 glycosyl transferase [Chitinophaga flava]